MQQTRDPRRVVLVVRLGQHRPFLAVQQGSKGTGGYLWLRRTHQCARHAGKRPGSTQHSTRNTRSCCPRASVRRKKEKRSHEMQSVTGSNNHHGSWMMTGRETCRAKDSSSRTTRKAISRRTSTEANEPDYLRHQHVRESAAKDLPLEER